MTPLEFTLWIAALTGSCFGYLLWQDNLKLKREVKSAKSDYKKLLEYERAVRRW